MGTQAVNADYSVTKDGDTWKLRDVAYDLRLSSLQNKTLPLLINAVKVDSEQVSVFPGTYTFTTGLKTIDYGKTNTLVVQSLSDYPGGIADIKPTITKTGEKEFTDAVGNSLEKCMKSKKLENRGCPNSITRVTGGGKVDANSLDWSYDKDALDNMKIRLDYANPAIAESTVSLRIKAEATCGGGSCSLTQYTNPYPSGNLTKDAVKITWG